MAIPGRFLAVLTLWHALVFELGESQVLQSLEFHGNASVDHAESGRVLSARRRGSSSSYSSGQSSSEAEEQDEDEILPLICRAVAVVGEVTLIAGAVVVMKLPQYQQHAAIMARACIYGGFVCFSIGILVPIVRSLIRGFSPDTVNQIHWVVILAIGNIGCSLLGKKLRRMSRGEVSVGEPVVFGAAGGSAPPVVMGIPDPSAAPTPAPVVIQATVVSTPAPVAAATVMKDGEGAREEGNQV